MEFHRYLKSWSWESWPNVHHPRFTDRNTEAQSCKRLTQGLTP